LELVLVLALLIVIAAIVYPSVDAMYGNSRLTQSADQVRAAWAAARSQAIDEGRPYRFAVVPNKGNFRIAPDSSDYWTSNASPAPSDPANPPLVLSETLPRGMRFNTADVPAGSISAKGEASSLPPASVPPGTWSTKAVFFPDGTAREDVEIIFGAAGTREIMLRLRALTGAVTVRASRPKEARRP
jgi:type II secretory pathway pseudopilin PulG